MEAVVPHQPSISWWFRVYVVSVPTAIRGLTITNCSTACLHLHVGDGDVDGKAHGMRPKKKGGKLGVRTKHRKMSRPSPPPTSAVGECCQKSGRVTRRGQPPPSQEDTIENQRREPAAGAGLLQRWLVETHMKPEQAVGNQHSWNGTHTGAEHT